MSDALERGPRTCPPSRPWWWALARVASVAAALCLPLGTYLLPGTPAHAAGDAFGDQSEPLAPLEAFVPRVTAVDADSVSLDWTIADGYYLYRDKLHFEIESEDPARNPVTLGETGFSDPIIVEDDFFGESAIYRDSAPMSLALVDRTGRSGPGGTSGTGGPHRLSITFQGCADIGLCYPPTVATLELDIPTSATPVVSTAVDASASPVAGPGRDIASPIRGLGALFGNAGDAGDALSEPALLRPEEAYRTSISRASTTAIDLVWDIEPGYYLYRDKFGFELVDADGAPLVSIDAVDLPPGEQQHDEFFGDTQIHRGRTSVGLVPAAGLAAGDEAVLRVAYQGCADIGVCFPPSTVDLPLIAVAGDPGNIAPIAVAAATGAPPLVSEQDRLSSLLADSSLWLSILTFYGLGLLLAFTPCVLPMVPILSGLIVGRSDALSGARAFRLSLVYVLVMASTYAVAGVLVAVSGQNVQIWLQDPVVLSLFAALFVVLALSMFGLFELQVPQALQAKLTRASNSQTPGRYRGVVAMGFLSTLIVGPCVTAPLAGALVYIADTGNAVVGGAALFAMGLGMGTPLLLIGTSAATLLPRTGVWMVRVKQGFGLLLLGLAIWMLSRFMPATSIVLFVGLLALFTGIWLGAADRIEAAGGGWPRVAKGAGLAVSLYGVTLLVGALAGSGSLITPLAVFGGANGGGAANDEEQELAFRRVATVQALDRAVAEAGTAGRAVMVDFYADWCISCKEMEAFTFSDERVRALLDDVTLLQVDVTENDADDKALLDRFRLFAPPAIVFYDLAGRELPGARVVGFMPAEAFADHLERVLATTVAER